MSLLAVAAVAFVTAVLIVPAVAGLAARLGAVAHPRRDRFSSRPVPTLGGLAIAAGALVGLGLASDRIGRDDAIAVATGLLAMLALGLADDLRTVQPRTRLAIQAVVGGAFALAVSGDMAPEIRLICVLAAIGGVPLVVNATNLVDNADGLAATLSTLTGVGLVGVAAVAGLTTSGSLVAAAIAGACVGFLFYNRPPAWIFMGDTGSLMLGFCLATSTILIGRDAIVSGTAERLSVLVAMPIAWLPQLADLAMVSITRMRRGVSPMRGGVDHTSHRLRAVGLGPWGMLGALGATGAACAALAALAADQPLVVAAVVLIVASVALASFEFAVVRSAPLPGELPTPTAAGVEADLEGRP